MRFHSRGWAAAKNGTRNSPHSSSPEAPRKNVAPYRMAISAKTASTGSPSGGHMIAPSSAAAVGIVIVVLVAILIAIFVWHPWSLTSSSTSTNGTGTTTTNTTTTGGGTKP